MSTTLYRRGVIAASAPGECTALVVADDGTIAWLGNETGADALRDGIDAVIDLEGDLVLPAFVDAHTHLSHTGLGLRGVDLSGCRTVTEALDRVAEGARATDGAVFAFGWEEQAWVVPRAMTRLELDRASGGRVVYASRVDGHSAVISGALAEASGAAGHDGWTETGFVVRDAKNRARAAFDALRTDADLRADIETALMAAAAAGIVEAHECGGPLLTSARDFAAVIDLGRSPHLPRTVGWWAEAVTEPEEAIALAALHGATGLGGDLNIDGSFGSHTALLRHDYTDQPGCHGVAYRSSADVRDHVAACAVAGLSNGFHVIGDAGLDLVLQGYLEAAQLVGAATIRASRPRLEHAELPDAAGVAIMAELGIAASVQPAFDAAWGGSGGMYAGRLGADRARATNPFALYADGGVALAFGSDSPVTPFAPWVAIRAATHPRVPDHALTLDQAFACHLGAGSARGLTVGSAATFATWQACDITSSGLPDVGGGRPLPVCRRTVKNGTMLWASEDIDGNTAV